MSENSYQMVAACEFTPIDRTMDKEKEKPSPAVRLESGKRLVISGSGICIVGIVIYCLSLCSADLGQPESTFISAGLAVIALGVICWAIGAVRFLNAGIDSSSPDDFIF